MLITCLIRNLEMFISLKSFMEIRAPEEGLPKIGSKIAKLHAQKRRFHGSNGDIEGIFPACSAKKSKRFLSMRSELFCEAHPLKRKCSFWFRSVYFFSTHCQRGFESLEIGHARRMCKLNCEITLNDEYLSQFLSDCKVLWMTLEQIVEIFIKLPIFDSSRAICVLLRGQNQLLVPSGWGKARKNSKIHRTPFRGRIALNKSAGKRSQKVTLITCPGHFLEKLISSRIYMPKNAILQVNPLGTSPDILLISTFGYFGLLLNSSGLGQKKVLRKLSIKN